MEKLNKDKNLSKKIKNNPQYKIKLHFANGLRHVVLGELARIGTYHVLEQNKENMYLKLDEHFTKLLSMKSIYSVSIATSSKFYNPAYISAHKGLAKDLISFVMDVSKDTFKTFKISCAGQDSHAVQSIKSFITQDFKMTYNDEADLKITIGKMSSDWEMSCQMTSRPLSLRSYKSIHMPGAMDPTIAFGLNSMLGLENKNSYLNPFCGSGTLLVESVLAYKNLEKVVGFDNNKTNLSIAYKNITKAKLIDKIKLYEKDIHDNPDLGQYDAIVADLPFGMVIGKGQDMTQLYATFLEYAYNHLNSGGMLGAFTHESSILLGAINQNHFSLVEEIEIKIPTTTGGYLHPSIVVLRKG